MQSLQGKLTESEATIESLKAELEAVNEKLAQAPKTDGADNEHEDSTKALQEQHAAEIGQLVASHEEQLQGLRTQLEEAEAKRKDIEETSVKALEDASQTAASQGDEKLSAAL